MFSNPKSATASYKIVLLKQILTKKTLHQLHTHTHLLNQTPNHTITEIAMLAILNVAYVIYIDMDEYDTRRYGLRIRGVSE